MTDTMHTCSTPERLVGEFMAASDEPCSPVPTAGSAETRSRWYFVLAQETDELLDELRRDDAVAIAKELADVVYAAYGTAIALGIDLDRVLESVHVSNMTKMGPDGPLARDGQTGKILKGPNFEPADLGWLAELVR